MSLRDTCDELDLGLGRWERYSTMENTYNARFELKGLLFTLVKLGEEQLRHMSTRMALDLYRKTKGPGLDLPGEERFEELKKRVEGL